MSHSQKFQTVKSLLQCFSAGLVVFAKMTNVWSRVAAFTQKYPLSRGMASYACIWPLGSLVQQKIQGKETIDYWRALRFSLYGCCFVAPTLYTWMTVAGYLFPKPGFRSGICKVSNSRAYIEILGLSQLIIISNKYILHGYYKI